MVILNNCYIKLMALGIDMNSVGSGDLFTKQLLSVFPNHPAWEYDFSSDQLKILVDEGEIIPDLSMFGEVIPNDNTVG